MSDRIEELLENPDKLLEWVDPWKGVNEEGEEVNIPVVSRMTVKNAIAFMRYARSKNSRAPRVIESNSELLHEFMSVYWATEVTSE